MDFIKIKERFNYELWRKIKIYAFTIESCNLARMFYGTGFAANAESVFEHIDMGQSEMYLGDEINIQRILTPFQPTEYKPSVKEFFVSLSPKSKINIYSLVTENLLLELISIFEDFIQNVLRLLLNQRPELALSKDKQISASSLLDYEHLEQLKEKLIDDKIHKTMYRKMKSIIAFIESGFQVNFELDNEIITKLYEYKEKRNLLVHNRGIVNDLFLTSLLKVGSKGDYTLGDRIKIDTEGVIELGMILKLIANEMFVKVTGDPPLELKADPMSIESEEILNSYLDKIKDDSVMDSEESTIEEIVNSFAAKTPHRNNFKVGRNVPCFCGSGLKFKRCCINKEL